MKRLICLCAAVAVILAVGSVAQASIVYAPYPSGDAGIAGVDRGFHLDADYARYRSPEWTVSRGLVDSSYALGGDVTGGPGAGDRPEDAGLFALPALLPWGGQFDPASGGIPLEETAEVPGEFLLAPEPASVVVWCLIGVFGFGVGWWRRGRRAAGLEMADAVGSPGRAPWSQENRTAIMQIVERGRRQ
jgi:hypothetical protein